MNMFKAPDSPNIEARPPSPIVIPPPPTIPSAPTQPTPQPTAVPRDRYGFKKSNQYVTEQQHDQWNAQYTIDLARRRKKWEGFMKQYGLSTASPIRFPPRGDKTKRYIRKGIPPEWRGAAWFWYAGGPARLAQQPGLYAELVEQVQAGKLNDADREHIERDLNRTFPDNIRFKPDVPAPLESHPQDAINGDNPHPDSIVPEPPLLRSLRRVLQVFAVHNPSIGYCQSLNFLAGLLLLFLDADEERSFILLNIITTEHLPGTHAKVLEANVDIGVLMQCIKESMPAVWAKIDDCHDNPASPLSPASVSNAFGSKAKVKSTFTNNSSTNNSRSNSKSTASGAAAGAANSLSTRLPTVSLATTAWFMSLFIGTLPIESVLRVWDSFFYEGSKTLFRIALAIFKSGEQEIRAVREDMEVFQVVQTIPRRLVDASGLMEACFRRRNGFGHLSQEVIDLRRIERRKLLADERARAAAGAVIVGAGTGAGGGRSRSRTKESGAGVAGGEGRGQDEGPGRLGGIRRAASRARFKRSQSRRRA
ncbi:hypothetical protein LTS18_014941 [Coniosporium uncinatum]|uniref:Uncharacterized protein n=1 Tax=Coniosporium uncinatum TaxID=93489 RepID=A0ACC3D8R6_9PEZI|nr:hypothetical protein LTS18_014941 [Coniosporium uncinatum]